jgi:hypothetical protein
MKHLLPLLLLVFIFFSKAVGQDTVKKDTTKAKQEKPYQILLHSITKHPDAYSRERRQQDSIHLAKLGPETHHPAIYIEGGFGYTFAGLRGIEGNYSLNYQYKKSLFTLRGLGTASYRDDPYTHQWFELYSQETGGLAEYSFLYGLRFVNNNQQALSFSAGIGDDRRSLYSYDAHDNKTVTRENYFGVPFEANYQIFSRRFGASFGIKLFGDISQHSFAGIGVNLGLGYHYAH